MLAFPSFSLLQTPTLLISACLIGQAVRYDGKSKKQSFLLNHLSERANLKPICPEVIAGFGVPRPAIQRVQTAADALVVQRVHDGVNVTEQLSQAVNRYSDELQQAEGLVLKARSPSCGIGDAALHNAAGEIVGYGSGLFVEQVQQLKQSYVLVSDESLQTVEQISDFVLRCSLLKEAKQTEDPQALLKHYKQKSLADWQARLCDLSQSLG